MKKIYYAFIIVLTVTLLFSTATFCSECSNEVSVAGNGDDTGFESNDETASNSSTGITGQQADEEKDESNTSGNSGSKDDKDDSKTTDTVESGSDTAEADKSGQTTATTAMPQEAPTIKLEISEGPTYSVSDDVCYYRIKAVVTGSPEPDIVFSKDDSNGAWGNYIAQVNITQQGQTYTLTATAKNPEGSASVSMDLNWGCSQSGSQTTDPEDDDDFIFDSDLVIIEKPKIFFPNNHSPVLTQSLQEPSDTLKVGQVFQIRCEGYDQDGDDFEALMAYSSSNFEFIEKVNPATYKWKALKAGNHTIDTLLQDEHGAYSTHILLTIIVVN